MAYSKYLIYIVIILLTEFMGVNSAYAQRAYREVPEYYHTTASYSCIVPGQPSAFELARRIAKNGLTTHNYDIILESYGFDMRELTPLYLAYALYLISERVGDDRAKDKMEWLERYMDEEMIDRITAVVYQKYSKSYLKACFSVDGYVPPLSVNDIYPLYFD
jgi:hypothetical protein